MSRILTFGLAALALQARLLAQQPPTEPPDATPVVPPVLPGTQEALLPNGLRLVVLEQHRQPILSVTLSVPAGSAFDPTGREGLSDMLAALMTRGAGKRTGPEVAAAIEAVGGSFSASAELDYLTIQADLLSNHAPLAFELIGNAVLRPALDSAEIESLRDQTSASLSTALDDPGTLAGRVFLVTTYRRHPYARRPVPPSVAAIKRQDLLAYLKARIRPAGSVLVVAGDITLTEARKLASTSLGAWAGVRAVPLPPAPPAPPPPAIVLVHAGGVKEAEIIVGNTTFGGGDTAYYAATVMSRILGDGGQGRLPRALNQEHGWSGVTGASFLRATGRGVFQASATIPVEDADSALLEMFAQLARLRTEPVPDVELARARENVAGSFALRLQTVGQLGRAVAESRQLGLPPSYLATYRKRILGVTPAQIRSVARRVFPDSGTIAVVVGDAARLYQPLSRIRAVRIFAADGRSLTPEAIQPRDVPLVFDPSQATGRTDSLAILTEGKTVGLQIARLARGGDTVSYVEETVLGSAVSQTTRLSFDTAGHMRNLEQVGKVRGQDTRIRLAYGNGRVRGSATIATPEGPRSLTVDTTVSASVIDDNGIPAILPLLKWELNTRWTLEVFASGENLIRPMRLTVADLTRISVPAGDFECYRADLDGAPQRVSFYVTSATPHRLVRVELAGVPFEFVAVNP